MSRINLRISDANKGIIESAAAVAELSITDFSLQHTIQTENAAQKVAANLG